MQYTYVLSASGRPLMPTTRSGHVRRLLGSGRARIASHVPFTIQLKYETPDQLQPLFGGTDPGRTNIGEAVVREDGTCVYRAHLLSRNREIPKLMAERKAHRQASRRGERLARKRLAKRLGTTMKHLLKRKLPGYGNGYVTVKDIINTESKINNRRRADGWITPTVKQLIQTHISMIRRICRILPVTYWSLEINKFAFMRMEDGTCYGADFQNGRMKGYTSVKDYVYVRQSGKCYFCGNPIEPYHHMLPRHMGGSNLPENIIGVCRQCHEDIHTGKLKPDVHGILKKYGALSVLNQTVPFILKELTCMFGMDHIGTCFGWQTESFREQNHLSKDHDVDAAAIAAACAVVNRAARVLVDLPECHEISFLYDVNVRNEQGRR